jgi:LPXTG-site transpeptidase (sortase) family protein
VGYSNFIVSNMSGSATIGPPLCVFVPLFNDLDCTANGDTTFQDGQGFDVSFDVNTADFSGTLDNPSGGVCRVDPDGLIEESNENNNDCSDTVVVNTADTGTIIIIKNTVPDAEQSFDFTGTGPEGYDFGGGFSLKNNGTDPNSMTFSGLLPSGSFTNAYTITEADPSGLGYLLTGIECESSKNVDILIEKGTTPTIDLLAGETVTCTFTNTLQTTPGIDKKITATNQDFTDPGDSLLPTIGTPPVAIGEIVQYQVVLTLDAGEYATAQLVDTMDPGLSFLNCISITPDSAVTTDLAGGFDAACAAPSFDPTPPTPLDVQRVVTFDLGTVTVDEGGGTLTFEYNAIVLDSIDNQDGHTLHNSAQLNWDTDQTLGPAVTEVVVNEPQLEIKKEADTKFIAVGSVVTFTVTFQHVTGVSHTPAFDVVLTDPIPSEFDYVDGSLDCTTESTNAPDAPVADVVANVITAGWSEFDIGDVGVCTFQLKANDTLVSGQETENVAFVDWTSLPGDPGQQNDNIYSTERNFIQDDPINDYQARSDVPFEAPGGGGGGKGRGFQIPSAGFAPGVYTDVGAPPSSAPYANVGVNLRIPKLGLNMAVEGVPYVNGTWQVDWLTGIGGWLTGTAFPGLPGNSVIMSHVVTHYGSNGPFARLYALEPGDYIFVTSFGRQYIYTVRWTKNVAPDDISVLAHEDKPVLTLMTCSEYNDQTQTYDGRLVVHAELIAVQPLK